MVRFFTPLRLLAVLALTLATLAVLGLAGTAGGSNPTQGADIYGVGGGQGNFAGGSYLFKFDLSAHEGNTDFGHISQSFTNTVSGSQFSFKIDVNCVQVFGTSTASLGGVVTSATTPNDFFISQGNQVVVTVQDGGNPSGPTPVDSITTPFVFGGQDQCKSFIVGFSPDVTQGNITVKAG